MYRLFTLLVCCSVSLSALADWTLSDTPSNLSFVSTKAGNVAEVHHLRATSGTIDDQGNARVVIDLASIDSSIAIRDERMRNVLFEIGAYPEAVVAAKINPAELKAIKKGTAQMMSLEASLDLHGTIQPFTMELVVARLSKQELLVATSKPVLLNAAQYDLASGVEKLREIAGLPSISLAVPVTVVLSFEAAR